MNLKVFCYLGRLRYPEQLEASLALLAEAQRTAAAGFLSEIKDLPAADLLRRWAQLRDDEYRVLLRTAERECGARLDEMPPALSAGWIAWLIDQHGPEHPQS